MFIVGNPIRGLARSQIPAFTGPDIDFVGHYRPAARLLRETSASAPRMAWFTAVQCGLTLQSGSITQLQLVALTQLVIAIGPSTASIISAKVIAAAGRESWIPPPAPRTERKSPPLVKMLTSFWTVGNAMPVSSESAVADVRTPPQWRAAAPITTTA
jgi:hypothetical protein